jgi:hypothetical protein
MNEQILFSQRLENAEKFLKEILNHIAKQDSDNHELKQWYTLKEACKAKNLNYKTACNRPTLKPNRGIPEAVIGGRNVWSRSTVMEWIFKSDDEILKKEVNNE